MVVETTNPIKGRNTVDLEISSPNHGSECTVVVVSRMEEDVVTPFTTRVKVVVVKYDM